MEIWLWPVSILLSVLTIALLIKIYLLRKSAEEIKDAFADRLTTDTNTLIDISSPDRSMRELADAVNQQLRILRSERHRFQSGDLELKNAVTNISHDLRTPLTAVCGYLDLLEQEPMSEAARRYTSIIRERTEILTQLTEELFRYSMLLSPEQELPLEPVAINEVLEESLAAFYAAFCNQGIAPDIQMPERKVIRMLNRSALARVFSNIFHNALKYSSGDLEITLSETGEIRFSNTAPGLSEIQIGKLFDRFYTVETARNSTGLGLSITQALVEQMNGVISVGYGAQKLCIRIFFPSKKE